MTNNSGLLSQFGGQVITRARLIALTLLVVFTAVAMQPAQAQSNDTWKSVAIIGGSTAAGAIFGHAIAGKTGTLIGAAAGAGVGVAIDHRRRQNEYNQYGYYGNPGYYPNNGYYGQNGGYYPQNGGYYGNGAYASNTGYYGGPNAGAYPYQGNYGPANGNRRGCGRRRGR